MIKIIRKNQKVFGVIFGVGLMVMFLANLGPQGAQTNTAINRQVASLNGTKIHQYDLNNYNAQWQTLKSLAYADPNQPSETAVPFVERELGPQLTGLIEQSQRASKPTPLFFLLVQEARQEGISISKEELQTVITNNVANAPPEGTDERAQVEESVANCLLIQKLARLQGSIVKISTPIQRYELANRAEDFTLSVEQIRAQDLLPQAPTPTDAQIRAQFDKFSDRVAAVPDRIPSQFGQTNNPLGFGYKVPNRVAIQYIGINYADLTAATIASKSSEDWYIAAFGEFKANRDEYDAEPVSSTTQPSAATQPTVTRLDNMADDFALHAGKVLDKLYKKESDSRLREIIQEINEKLTSGFGVYHTAVAASSKQITGDAAEYINFKFMRDLGDAIKTKYGITPILGNIQQLKSETQLANVEGIGSAQTLSENNPIPFPVYAARLFQPWMSDLDKNSQLGALALSQWQPSNTLIDEKQNFYVFRISGSDAAHVPDLKDVKDDVVADCKMAAAYAKAQQIAKLLLTSAQQSGLEQAAARTKLLPPPVVTEPFNANELLSGSPRIPAEIAPLILKPDSARALASASQQLLITAPSQSKAPLLVTELPADRSIAVIELLEATPIWNAETMPLYTAQITRMLENEQLGQLELALFQPDAVATRLGYQPIKP